jgi:hypothetical protein
MIRAYPYTSTSMTGGSAAIRHALSSTFARYRVSLSVSGAELDIRVVFG